MAYREELQERVADSIANTSSTETIILSYLDCYAAHLCGHPACLLSGYLFNHKALAKVFRAKMLDAIKCEGLALPPSYPETWVVDLKSVGTGEKALVYLGRYLYKGVILREGYYRLREWPGDLSIPERQNETKRIPNGLRRPAPVVC